jgi:YD repeat-containing protein
VGSIILPASTSSLVISSPKAEANFTSSLSSGTAADVHYQVKQNMRYHSRTGNLQELQPADGINIAYLWGYQNTLPVAKLVDAKPEQVFYTSFEEDGTVSAHAKTGKRIYKGSFSFPLPVQAGAYKLTYWRKPSGRSGWEFVTERVHVPTNTTGKTIGDVNTDLDEVRLYPIQAQMTTFAYDPLIGMSSSTDSNNTTAYYEYDDLGRLSRVKDDKGNTVRSFQYHYRKE